MKRCAGAAALLLLAAAAPAAAQLRGGTVASGVQFQGYDFADELGVEAVNLLMVPVAYQLAVGERLSFDVYSAFARGAALVGGTEFTLSGLVDTRVRASYGVVPWAVLTVGLNLPTGRTEHTENEARVAAALASDLLGFREANFGLGFGATTGIATAHRVGDTGVGAGISYRYASAFEPRADTTLRYTPGDEIRVRVGVDRNIGSGKLTAGVTYQNFARDQLSGRDLFQPGNRWRGDVTYSFRTGPAATWSAFVTDVWRDRGDVRLETLDPQGRVQSSESVRTGSQNLIVAGLAGSWRARSGLALQPLLDARVLTREDDGGEGWLIGAGAGVPLRLGRFHLTPLARASFGSIQGEQPVGHRLLGGEAALTISWSGR